MNIDLGNLFSKTCVELGAASGIRAREAMWRALADRYLEPHRAYHTLQHLEEIFSLLADLGVWVTDFPNLYFALFYHDAIYEVGPGVRDNKEKSLALARNVARDLGHVVVDDLEGLIMATKHHGVQATTRRTLCVDVDIAIVGAPRGRYMEYAAQIRKEYARMSDDAYRARRLDVLKGFLAHKPIFGTPEMRERREAQARANIQYEIDTLSGQSVQFTGLPA